MGDSVSDRIARSESEDPSPASSSLEKPKTCQICLCIFLGSTDYIWEKTTGGILDDIENLGELIPSEIL